MKIIVKSLLLILACTLSAQVVAQSIKIADVAGLPGDTVTVDVTLTPDPTGTNLVAAVDLFMKYNEVYDALSPTGGAACGGDVFLTDVNQCIWGGQGSGAYSIVVVKASGFGLAPVVIARVSFTIPTTATPGTVDTLIADPSSVIGPAPTTVTPGSIEVLAGPQPAWTSDPVPGSTIDFGTLNQDSGTVSSSILVTNTGEENSELNTSCFLESDGAPAAVAVPFIISKSSISSLGAGSSDNITVGCDTDSGVGGLVTDTLVCPHNGSDQGSSSPAEYPLSCFIVLNQTIISAAPATGTNGTAATLSAVASSGLTNFNFTGVTGDVCTVSGTDVTYIAAGDCIVNVVEPGNENYNATPVFVHTITVSKADQTITNLAVTGAAVVDGVETVSATPGGGTEPLVFSSTTDAVCTVVGDQITYNTAGDCTVTADQAADDNYNAAPQESLTFTVAKAPQEITGFTADPDGGEVNETSTLSATGGNSGNPVTFGTTTGTVCSVDGDQVTYLASGQGPCTVFADQAGDENYLDAVRVTKDLGVALAPQEITNLAASGVAVVDGTATLSATPGGGTAPLLFGRTAATSAVCTVAGTTVSYLTAGTCTVTADQAADANYSAAEQVTLDITVAKADQDITNFIATPASGEVDQTSTLSSTPGKSTSPVVYASTTESICTVSGATVNFLAAGTCNVTANQDGDANYNDAPELDINIASGKADQAISGFAASPNTGKVGESSTLSAVADSTPTTPTAVPSGLPVEFDSDTPGICTVSGNTVNYVAVGTCTVTADQPGDANYNPAPQVTLDITVAKGDQNITSFTVDPDNAYVDSTSDLSGTASSGLAVQFSSDTPDICVVSGSVVEYILDGECSLTASQPGDANWNAAPPVTILIEVSLYAPTPVPTLSQWSQILMLLLMLAIGGTVIRRRTTR